MLAVSLLSIWTWSFASGPVEPEVVALLDSVDVGRMERLLRTLVYKDTSLPYDNSISNLRNRYALNPITSDTLEGVPAVLARMLREAMPKAHIRFLPFRHEGGPTLYNISAVVPGSGPGKFLLTAHYDAIVREDPDSLLLRRFGPRWKEALEDPSNPVPTPGADDNGSGLMAVLEAARWLSRLQLPWSLEVVLFSGEELGQWGSKEYVKKAKGEAIFGVFNVDMVAYNKICDRLDIVANAFSEPLLDMLSSANVAYDIGLRLVKVVDPTINYGDHAPFWWEGFPAVLIMEYKDPWHDDPEGLYRRNEAFHTVHDVMDSLNLSLWEKTAKLLVATIAGFAHPVGLPDIVVWPGCIRPSREGLRVAVRNASAAPSGPFRLEVLRCGPDSSAVEVLWSGDVPPLPGGAMYGVELPIGWEGDALLLVKADAGDEIEEGDEGNNFAFQLVRRRGGILSVGEVFPYPNPSEGPVRFHYNLSLPGTVWLEVFTGMGRKVWEKAEERSEGWGEMVWPADVPPGLYLFKISAYQRGSSSPSDVRWGKVALIR